MRVSRLTACLWLILFVSSSRPGTASAQDTLKRAEQLRVEAQAHFLDGQFAVGISKAREALAMSEKVLPPNDIRLANPLFNLAQILQAKAHYTEARTLYERAVKIIELDRGPDHPPERPGDNLHSLHAHRGRQHNLGGIHEQHQTDPA